jgi:hypothetical protein
MGEDPMLYFKVAIFFALLLLGLDDRAFGQSACTKCMQAVQVKVVTCNGKLPPAVTPKDSKKPTDAERKAAKARADAYSACVKIANEGMTACRNSSACPK